MSKIQLGATVTDTITGFSGVITAVCYYLTGCNQALVQPQLKKGEYKEPMWFDFQRLKVGKDKVITLDNGATPGFDKSAPKR